MNEKQDTATIVIGNDPEITADQQENPGSPCDDEIEAANTMNSDVIVIREAGKLGGALYEIGDADNLGQAEPGHMNDSEEEIKSSVVSRSPHEFCSHKK